MPYINIRIYPNFRRRLMIIRQPVEEPDKKKTWNYSNIRMNSPSVDDLQQSSEKPNISNQDLAGYQVKELGSDILR